MIISRPIHVMESRSHWLRATLLARGRAYGGRIIGYHFDSRIHRCLERNATRGGQQRVPDIAVYVAAKRLDVPSHAEGFDCLYRVRLVGQAGVRRLSQLETALTADPFS